MRAASLGHIRPPRQPAARCVRSEDVPIHEHAARRRTGSLHALEIGHEEIHNLLRALLLRLVPPVLPKGIHLVHEQVALSL